MGASWKKWVGSISAIGLMAMVGCSWLEPQPEACPRVGERLSLDMSIDIDWAVKDMLLDPGSYEVIEKHGYLPVANRADEYKYYSVVGVDFRAKNSFGGYVPGWAEVVLGEDREGNCQIMSTDLL